MNTYSGLADQVADMLTPERYLCRAIEAGDTALVKLQLDAGADPNLEYTYETRYGFTRTSYPLIVAAYEGNATIAALLLLAGADPGTYREKRPCTSPPDTTTRRSSRCYWKTVWAIP